MRSTTPCMVTQANERFCFSCSLLISTMISIQWAGTVTFLTQPKSWSLTGGGVCYRHPTLRYRACGASTLACGRRRSYPGCRSLFLARRQTQSSVHEEDWRFTIFQSVGRMRVCGHMIVRLGMWTFEDSSRRLRTEKKGHANGLLAPEPRVSFGVTRVATGQATEHTSVYRRRVHHTHTQGLVVTPPSFGFNGRAHYKQQNCRPQRRRCVSRSARHSIAGGINGTCSRPPSRNRELFPATTGLAGTSARTSRKTSAPRINEKLAVCYHM